MMTGSMHQQDDQTAWRAILARLDREYAGLGPAERQLLAGQLTVVGAIQEAMQALFAAAGGGEVCRDCRGYCCDRAKNHLTLVNLLAYLAAGERPPEPDFALPCPFAGPDGCLHETARRPFNCVTFLCERVEERVDGAALERFYALERQLRLAYEAFDRRFAGSSLRGIFIRAARLGERPLLGAPPL
jgi:hypothetical protein